MISILNIYLTREKQSRRFGTQSKTLSPDPSGCIPHDTRVKFSQTFNFCSFDCDTFSFDGCNLFQGHSFMKWGWPDNTETWTNDVHVILYKANTTECHWHSMGKKLSPIENYLSSTTFYSVHLQIYSDLQNVTRTCR